MADLTEQQAAITAKITGSDLTGLETNYVAADSSGNLQVKDAADGAVGSAVPTTAIQVAGKNGSGNLQALLTDASGNLGVDLKDGVGNAITSSQNDAVQSLRLLHVQRPDTTVATTALGALNAAVSIPVTGLTSVGFQISAGTLIGTIVPEISMDGGTTWFASTFYDFTTAATLSNVVFSSVNTLKMYSVIILGGTSNARVRVSAYTSGTANSVMRVTAGLTTTITPSGAGGGFGAFGTATTTYLTPANNTITLFLAANPGRKYALISNPTGSQLNILIGNGGVGLTASSGIVIAAKAFYEFRGDNLWTGAIYGFMAGGGQLTIVEGTA
jgi:hypothetical protein